MSEVSGSHAYPVADAPVTPPELRGLSALRALSLNHRSLGVQALQDVALDGHRAAALHATLSAAQVESLVLVTCNRTEIYWHSRGIADDSVVLRACEQAIPAGELADRSLPTHLQGADVAWHLFRVCAGLESLVLGEAEILGQVRTALDACPGIGTFLRGVVQAAVRAGRMARAETAIGVGARSVASATVHLVATALPPGAQRVLVLGAGATGLKVVTQLRARGVTQLVVANRSLDRAEAVAGPIGAEAVALDRLHDELLHADAVVAAVHAPTPLVSQADLAAAVAARGRPLVVADISMPPAIEPGAVAGVTRIDLASIDAFVNRERDRRAAEIPRVEVVLAREMRYLETWVRRQTLRPFVSGLRRKVEAIRQAELARMHDELGAPAVIDATILERLSRRLLDQVLAVPLATLETGALPLDQAQADYLYRLFALDGEAPQ